MKTVKSAILGSGFVFKYLETNEYAFKIETIGSKIHSQLKDIAMYAFDLMQKREWLEIEMLCNIYFISYERWLEYTKSTDKDYGLQLLKRWFVEFSQRKSGEFFLLSINMVADDNDGKKKLLIF